MLAWLVGCSEYELGKSVDHAEPPEDTGCGELVLPDPYAVTKDDGCAWEPEPGTFTPVVEWQWSASTGAPGYDDVMMMPAVGDVDLDGVPEVVFTSYAGNGYGSPGALVIASGDGAGEEAAFTSIGGYAPLASAGVALGDVDGDGTPEIVTLSADGRVLALHADGTLVWATDPSGNFSTYGYPVLADMEGDGRVEVVAGRDIYDARGRLRGSGGYGWGGDYCIPVVVDLDMDGEQEVVVGNAAYGPDGTAKWANGMSDGWVAVGDFDLDGDGEIATVTGGYVYLLATDGSVLWGPVAVPGGGGGPPTVADFDGDGWPEVGVAGASGYAVYDTDGAVLWQQTTTDASSARTGSSVFDFEGDGAWEVVYGDELVLWVYDGATGAPVLMEEGHSSWTLFEYPVVADVDGDGESEIVLASNDSINSGWQGITVIGDASGSWAPSAPVWNQHAYHITNVNDDLSIPASPEMNWNTGHNSFRAGGLGDRLGNPAPNLRAVARACWECDAEEVELVVQVENAGLADVQGPIQVAVSKRTAEGTELAQVKELSAGVLAGEASEALVFTVRDLDGVDALLVTADDDGARVGTVEECDEDDNRGTVEAPACD
ncbi:MAG: FG-GAP-like repeat-containing protein [Myxococcota bacterium]